MVPVGARRAARGAPFRPPAPGGWGGVRVWVGGGREGGGLRLLGLDPNQAGDRVEIRRQLGYMPQEPGFYRNFTAFEFVDYVGILKGMSDRSRRRDEVMRVLG